NDSPQLLGVQPVSSRTREQLRGQDIVITNDDLKPVKAEPTRDKSPTSSDDNYTPSKERRTKQVRKLKHKKNPKNSKTAKRKASVLNTSEVLNSSLDFQARQIEIRNLPKRFKDY
ncbi:unnamed protein product, partial [Auanema sp. JU1783]